MAAGDIALNDKIATVECDDTARRITIASAGASLVNVGSNPVFLSMVDGGDLSRDGLQRPVGLCGLMTRARSTSSTVHPGEWNRWDRTPQHIEAADLTR